jgi:hypothetical protein
LTSQKGTVLAHEGREMLQIVASGKMAESRCSAMEELVADVDRMVEKLVKRQMRAPRYVNL